LPFKVGPLTVRGASRPPLPVTEGLSEVVQNMLHSPSAGFRGYALQQRAGGLGSQCPAWLYDADWNLFRLTARGVGDSQAAFRVQTLPNGFSFVLR